MKPRKTSITLNWSGDVPAQRTIVTIGQQRGGTSSVAGVQRALGLHLGDIRGGNNEDHNFMHPPRGLGHLRKTIKERNSSHDVWGFKFPTAASFLPMVERNLRNPRYVVVHRDPVATALSRWQWDGDQLARPIRMSLTEASSISDQNMAFAMATDRPVLLISTAKATTEPGAMIDEVADFIGAQPPSGELREQLLAYLEPGSYKDFDEFFPHVVPLGSTTSDQRDTGTPAGSTSADGHIDEAGTP